MSQVSDIRAYIQSKKKAMRGVVADALGELSGRIIDRTPVLTGRLKGNWQATLDSPSAHSLLTTDPTGTVTAGKAEAKAAMAPGHVYYFVNNAAYAHFIEYGGSRFKAPAGMLRVSLVEFDSILQWAVARNRA